LNKWRTSAQKKPNKNSKPARYKKGAELKKLEIPAEIAGFKEENHCRPVTPTSQAERDSPHCGLSLNFFIPESNAGIQSLAGCRSGLARDQWHQSRASPLLLSESH